MTRSNSFPRPAQFDSARITVDAEGSRFWLAFRKGFLQLFAGFAGVLLGCSDLRAADEPKDDEVLRARLEFMTRKLDTFVIVPEKSPKQPLVREKAPVLRFSNPTRNVCTDGVIFVWLSGERPVAAGSLWIGADGTVRREFTSLSDQSLQCRRDEKTVWAPPSDGFAMKPLPESPKPAATPALRLAQMRKLAARYSGDFVGGAAKDWEELRLMPQPLYRYTADKGAVEGAIFALAQSNDPEVLVVLELAPPKPGAPPVWNYGIARMSSSKMRVRLDDKEIWSVKAYWSNPRVPEDPYQEAEDGKFP